MTSSDSTYIEAQRTEIEGAAARRPDAPARVGIEGLLQRSEVLRVQFAVPETADLRSLSQWLHEVLAIEAAAQEEQPASDPAARARAFAGMIAKMARLFLELGRVPVFELPHLVSLDRSDASPRAWVAALAFPLVENLPANCLRIALESALRLCRWACANPVSAETRAEAFRKIESDVTAPLRRIVPGGGSTIPVLRAAHRADIPCIHLGAGVYQLGWGSKARRMDRSISDRDTVIGARLSQDKMVAAGLLRMAGLPAPVHLVVPSREQALRAASDLGYPLVVKPSDRDRGEGVRVDVVDEASLTAAFDEASRLARNRRVIVERQVPGVCHRLFIAGGRLLYAVKRSPMSVIGDGRSSIAELVGAELVRQQALPPWDRNELRPIDEAALAAMAREGFTPVSIPPEGSLVPLRRIESTEWGGTDEAVGDRVHPDNLAIALRAAALFGLETAGIDLITPDISVPWHRNGAIVNEVNLAPLFGGGEISRAHIPEFLRAFLDGDGRIPIESFEGAQALERARARFAQLRAAGQRCFVTSADRTLDNEGAVLHLAVTGLGPRLLALVCRSDVDAILLVRDFARAKA